MKCRTVVKSRRRIVVTPSEGEWIEIVSVIPTSLEGHVTPSEGEWIEIGYFPVCQCAQLVTPSEGEWIEIICNAQVPERSPHHSLRRSMDWSNQYQMKEIIYPLICMPANVVITPGAGVTMKISYNI